jgi:Ca-activated chloride channel homolog
MHRSFCTLRRTLDLSGYLWLLFACGTLFGVLCRAADAQDCVQCATNAVPKASGSTGEWVLTKQVNEVNVFFVAARRGKLIRDLSQNDISVWDDNKPPAAILGFRTELELPLRVGMAIDTSSSVTSRFRFEQAAASIFFRQAVNRDRDLGFILGFSDDATVTQDFVGDPDLLSQGVNQLTIGGGTALYEAIRTSCHKLLHRPERAAVARVLVVLSDGQNNSGKLRLEGAIDAAHQAEVTIYAISTNYPTSSVEDPNAAEGNANLRKLAEQTGGRVLFPFSPKEVAKAFVKIGEELRGRYAVSYKPADFTPDGHYRKIKIEARKDGDRLRVRARKGYYARPASGVSSGSPEADRNVIMSSR